MALSVNKVNKDRGYGDIIPGVTPSSLFVLNLIQNVKLRSTHGSNRTNTVMQ